jgi:hypothetical protein
LFFTDYFDDERFDMLNDKMNAEINMKKLLRKTGYPFKPYPTQQDLNGTMNLATVKVADEDKNQVQKVLWNIFPSHLLGVSS